MTARCPICKGELLRPIKSFFGFPNIVSDCRPYKPGRSVASCLKCGMFCRVLDDGVSFADVYENYSVLSHGGDQMNFDNGMQGRTAKILSVLSLNNVKTVLDIGSGNGAGLRELQKRFSAAIGYDPHSLDDNILHDRPDGKFDLITMFHVLEHVEDLRDMLTFIKESLTQDGRLLIQVPYAVKWPFDFIIADHLWHFTMQSMTALLHYHGFETISIGNSIIEKEITCIARVKSAPLKAFVPQYETANMFTAIHWLNDYKQHLDKITSPVAVYGAAPAAAWAANTLGENALYHIDDNPALWGKTLNGRSIMDTQTKLPVVAPFFGKQLESIRVKSPHCRFK